MLSFGINCDLGESYGLFRIGNDEGVMPHIHTANVACGFHGGDPSVIRKALRLAKRYGVRCGAHPSLPDLQGFGRREMGIDPEELTNMVIYQFGAVRQLMAAEGMRCHHVKPHGVLYSMLYRLELADAFADAIEAVDADMAWIIKEGTPTYEVARKRKMKIVTEFTADREYDRNGDLIITRVPDPVDPAKAAAQVQQVLDTGMVTTVEGTKIAARGDAVCIHSDTPNSADVARAISELLKNRYPQLLPARAES